MNADSTYAILTSAGSYEVSVEDAVAFDNGDTLVVGASPVGDNVVDLAEGAVETVDFELDEISCNTSG